MRRNLFLYPSLVFAASLSAHAAPTAAPEGSFPGSKFDALIIASNQAPVRQQLELKPGPYHALFKPDSATSVQIDLNHDSKPDLLETTFNGRRVIWIADGGTMKWGAQQGNMSTDCIMVVQSPRRHRDL